MSLPQNLFRGDDDRDNERMLRMTSHYHQFHNNLIKGGIGERIFTEPLMELTNKHILSRFPGSHFLSFTDNELSAFRYGLRLMEADAAAVDSCCSQYYSDDKQWDFAILNLQTADLQIKDRPFPGVYECWYQPTLLEFVRFGFYRIFLIDAFTALQHTDPAAYDLALEYTTHDKEWLVLPAMPKVFQGGKVEYSAVLDGGCFGQTNYYKIDQKQHKIYNTITY